MNILIVRLDNIGDILITLGITDKIKEKYPTANIAYIVRKPNTILPQMYGYIDNIIEYDPAKDIENVMREISSYNFDYIIDLKSSPSFLLALEKLNIPIIRRVKKSSVEYLLKFIRFAINFDSYKHVKVVSSKNTMVAKAFVKLLPWLFSRLKNNKLIYLSNTKMLHESQIAELFLFPLGITKLNDIATNSSNIANNFNSIGDFLTSEVKDVVRNGKFNLVVHPGSNGHGEEWPIAKYIELIQSLESNSYNIFITGSKQEWQTHGSAIANQCPNVINFTNKFDLQGFVRFLTSVDALIASGTGPLHLSAAIGAHALGLFPTRPGINSSRWKPLGAKVTVFEEQNMSDIRVEDIKRCLDLSAAS